MFQLHEVLSCSLGQEAYALNLTADGAVSQPEAIARPKERLLHLCAEELKNNIRCSFRRKIGLLIAVPAEKCMRSIMACPADTNNVGWD